MHLPVSRLKRIFVSHLKTLHTRRAKSYTLQTLTPRTGTPSSPFPEPVFQHSEQTLPRSTAIAAWRPDGNTPPLRNHLLHRQACLRVRHRPLQNALGVEGATKRQGSAASQQVLQRRIQACLADNRSCGGSRRDFALPVDVSFFRLACCVVPLRSGQHTGEALRSRSAAHSPRKPRLQPTCCLEVATSVKETAAPAGVSRQRGHQTTKEQDTEDLRFQARLSNGLESMRKGAVECTLDLQRARSTGECSGQLAPRRYVISTSALAKHYQPKGGSAGFLFSLDLFARCPLASRHSVELSPRPRGVPCNALLPENCSLWESALNWSGHQ